MSSTTVAEFASELKKSPETLLEQLKSAGVSKAAPSDALTESDKQKLLAHLQASHGVAAADRKKITLVTRSTSEIKQADASGKAQTDAAKKSAEAVAALRAEYAALLAAGKTDEAAKKLLEINAALRAANVTTAASSAAAAHIVPGLCRTADAAGGDAAASSQPKTTAELKGLVYSETPKEDLIDPDEAVLPFYQRTVPLALIALGMVVVLNFLF